MPHSWRRNSLLSLALALLGCGGGSGGGQPPPTPTPASPTRAATATASGTIAASATPTSTPTMASTPATLAFVIATDFQTGSFALVSVDERRVVFPAGPRRQVNADAVARSFGDRVYVVNRFGFSGDNVQRLDPRRDFSTDFQCSTGAGTNPHDIAFAGPTKAYVTLYETTRLLIVNPSVAADCAGFVVGSIDLAQFADRDGIPEMDQLAIVEGRLYVTLQRLDRDNFFAPAGRGLVVIVDTAIDQVTGTIELTGENPFAVRTAAEDDAIFISQVGNFTVHDGGIERVDLESETAEGFVISEADVGGDITDFVLTSEELGYAVIGGSDFRNSLVGFDLVGRTIIRTLISGGDFISNIELTGGSELLASDRSVTRPGLRIFRADDGVELTVAPLDVGLAPFGILVLR
jgi:hypothetical protein